MKDERIEVIKNWPEPTSIRDIQIFIGFANFYQRFIQSFSRIAAPLISMLKTIGSSVELALKANIEEDIGDSSARADKTVVNLSILNSSYMLNIGAMREYNFLTFDTKKAFNRLKQTFIKALILLHFDPKSHI